jgi:hypothetical protein
MTRMIGRTMSMVLRRGSFSRGSVKTEASWTRPRRTVRRRQQCDGGHGDPDEESCPPKSSS